MSKTEINKIKKLRKLFPEMLTVDVQKTDEGYVAEIKNWPGAFTEAKTFSELIFMVNDCAQTVLEVPEKYAAEMPNYSPPIELAQKFGEFPLPIKKKEIIFILNGANVLCQTK